MSQQVYGRSSPFWSGNNYNNQNNNAGLSKDTVRTPEVHEDSVGGVNPEVETTTRVFRAQQDDQWGIQINNTNDFDETTQTIYGTSIRKPSDSGSNTGKSLRDKEQERDKIYEQALHEMRERSKGSVRQPEVRSQTKLEETNQKKFNDLGNLKRKISSTVNKLKNSAISKSKKSKRSEETQQPNELKSAWRQSIQVTESEVEAETIVVNNLMAQQKSLLEQEGGQKFENDLGKRVSQEIFINLGNEQDKVAEELVLRTDTCELLRCSILAEMRYLSGEMKHLSEQIRDVSQEKKPLQNERQQLEKGVEKTNSRRGGLHFESEEINLNKYLNHYRSVENNLTGCQETMNDVEARLSVLVGRYATLEGYSKILSTWEDDVTWCATTSWRVLFRNYPEIAKYLVIPLFMNHRRQTVWFPPDASSAYSFNRGGAVTDFSNGSISLKELMFHLMGLKTGNGFDEHTIQELVIFQTELAQYNQDKFSNELQDRVAKAYFSDDQKFSLEALERIVEQRRLVLFDILMQDLYVHFKNDPVKENRVTFGRLSLLDATKKAERDGNLVIDECTELLDMEEVYRQLGRKQILFDLESEEYNGEYRDAYYMDLDGVIHMPKRLDERGDEAKGSLVECKTIVLNISCQNNTRNEGPQAIINNLALKKIEEEIDAKEDKNLQDELRELYGELETDLIRLETDPDTVFDVEETAVRLMRRLGVRLSINCYGGKDRTGYLAALIVHDTIEDDLKKQHLDHKKPLEEIMVKVDCQLMKTIRAVVEDNMGVGRGVKLDPKNPIVEKTGSTIKILTGGVVDAVLKLGSKLPGVKNVVPDPYQARKGSVGSNSPSQHHMNQLRLETHEKLRQTLNTAQENNGK